MVISPTQKKACLQFAETYVKWTLEEWRHVIWTDEMGMQTGANCDVFWSGESQKKSIMKIVVVLRTSEASVKSKYGEQCVMESSASWRYFQVPESKEDGKLKAQ